MTEPFDIPDPDPRFLKPEAAPAPTLPLDEVLSPVLAQWVKDSADAKGAPPDYVFGALLACAASAIGNTRWVKAGRLWTEPPVIWVALIGNPSSNKSPGLDAVIKPYHRALKPIREKAIAALRDWENEAAIAKANEQAFLQLVREAAKSGDKKPERPASADVGPKPHVPRVIVNDATMEAITVMAANQDRLIQVRDELSGWLLNMERYTGGSSDRPFWIEAYGGRPYSSDRLSRADQTIEQLSICLLGGLQPDRLNTLLMKTDDDGLLARTLPFWPNPAPITLAKKLPDDAVIERVFERLLALEMDQADGEPFSRLIWFSDEAELLMLQFRKDVRAREEAQAGKLLSFNGKMPGFAARISLVLAYLDYGCGAADQPTEITAQHFARAALLVEEYFLPMAMRAYAAASLTKGDKAAYALLKIIRDEHLREFSTRDILRKDRANLHRAADVDSACSVLLDAGCVMEVATESSPQGGRPAKRYRVHPKITEASQ